MDQPIDHEATLRQTGLSQRQQESAVEIMVFNPHLATPPDKRGVHENLWIKEQRFKNRYVSIGVYLDGSDLKYYFFKDCENKPLQIYSSLAELKKELPSGLDKIFENTPKLFLMGHGDHGHYGLANTHMPTEVIYGDDFDKLIDDIEKAWPERQGKIFVTLEACNTDDLVLAAKHGQQKTFLERVSSKHKNMTFCGTGPWNADIQETGNRASGGYPTLNVPVTAVVGGIWKNGNSVIFYHDHYQVVVIKSKFASTETAKTLKLNTIEYARDCDASEEMITKICANRKILKIEDLKNVPGFPFESHLITERTAKENQIIEKENNNYRSRAREIVERREYTDRDLLIIALGLKDLSVFKGHEDLRDKILADKTLLKLLIVTCGKVLIAGPSNDSLIDLLLENLKNGAGVNSVDQKGMTALHYAVQNFYSYRKEPLDLINKLLDCGADLNAKDNNGQTPLMLATEHAKKDIVRAGGNLLALLQQNNPADDRSHKSTRPSSIK